MIVAWLSRVLAVPEPALRLLISVLIGKLSEFFLPKEKILQKLSSSIFFLLLIFRGFFTNLYSSPLFYTAYPIVICYRCFLHNNSSFTKKQTNLLFTACGIAICTFNYGFEVYHSLIAVTFTYAIINLLYNSRYLVPVSFTFHMLYLLIGDYLTLISIEFFTHES